MTLRVMDIVRGTSVDGPGLRDSVYFAGCCHACEGCHNPQSWDFGAGTEMELDDIMSTLKEDDFDVTFSGGDPMYRAAEVAVLAERIKTELGKNIWCFTGFLFEELLADEKYLPLLNQIDVLVDGPYEKDKKDLSLRFRGSSNQRIIDVQKSILARKAIVINAYMNKVEF